MMLYIFFILKNKYQFGLLKIISMEWEIVFNSSKIFIVLLSAINAEFDTKKQGYYSPTRNTHKHPGITLYPNKSYYGYLS